MNGGAAHVGSVGVTCSIRSWTSCRARSRSVPDSKISSTDERSFTDFERMMSSPSTPARACSSGIVTSASTSDAERPHEVVWTSTLGGANSGNTSTGMFRSWARPKNIMAVVAATTSQRKRRLVATIERIMSVDLPPSAQADVSGRPRPRSRRRTAPRRPR